MEKSYNKNYKDAKIENYQVVASPKNRDSYVNELSDVEEEKQSANASSV